MQSLLLDLRYALRFLKNSPGFTAVAVLTLALGIGTNSAVFSLVNAVLLRPLPYPQPDRLVLIWESAPFFGLHDSPVSPTNYLDWRARARSFEDMGALEERSYRLLGDGPPEVIEGSLASAGLLRALRTRPQLGRIFTDAEDQPGAAKVVILSDGFWRRRFAADRGIVGKTITLGEDKHTIVGVLAPGAEPPADYFARPGEVWAPFGTVYTAEQLQQRGRHNWMVVARLRDGVSLAQADKEMGAIGAQLAREYPDTNAKVGAFVAPMRDHFVRSSRSLLYILLGTVVFVLLIACSNLANLLISRAANRSKEVAVRAALGAGAWQMARQFLSESLLLGALGGALGLLLASAAFPLLALLAPSKVSGFDQLSLDWRVLAFTLVVALLTSVAFGLVPLLQVRRLDVSHALKQSSRNLAAAWGSRRLRSLLITGEVALAFVLLIGAGLLIETLARLHNVNLGCRTDHVLTLRLPASRIRRETGRNVAFQREVLRRVRETPGVLSAGFTNHIPLAFKGDISGVGAEGHDPQTRFQVCFRMAGPGYLNTMAIPLVRGRDLGEQDASGAPPVVLINETLARLVWPGQDPIGRHLLAGGGGRLAVVGVVGDVHQSGLDAPPKPEYYVSALQVPYPPDSLAIHTKVDPESLIQPLRAAIWSIDHDQPIVDIGTMQDILSRELRQRNLHTTLLTFFAALALLLSAIGLYGVLAYVVGQQSAEIGLRMALGAEPAGMLRRFIGQGLRLALLGLAIGFVAALALSRLLENFLFGVRPTNPLTYALVALLLLSTAGAASFLPARRAMLVDPIRALREE